jgi:hypothetical protein
VAGIVFGRELTYGSSAQIGPGYFPTILSYLLIAIGLLIGGRGLATDGPAVEHIPFRPIFFVLFSILTFGFLIERIGLALTAVIITFIASASRRGSNLKETAILGVVLSVISVAVFVYGLGQPMPVWWGGD